MMPRPKPQPAPDPCNACFYLEAVRSCIFCGRRVCRDCTRSHSCPPWAAIRAHSLARVPIARVRERERERESRTP